MNAIYIVNFNWMGCLICRVISDIFNDCFVEMLIKLGTLSCGHPYVNFGYRHITLDTYTHKHNTAVPFAVAVY